MRHGWIYMGLTPAMLRTAGRRHRLPLKEAGHERVVQARPCSFLFPPPGKDLSATPRGRATGLGQVGVGIVRSLAHALRHVLQEGP